MIEVKREESETIEHLVRRYSDKLKRIKFIDKVKKGSFYQRPINKHQKKVSALYRQKKRKKLEYLKKIGKFEDRSPVGYYKQRTR
jgi:ribosomal protein S21